MTSHDLIAAILADPNDDSPRLIAADWFDENGQPERAEFIRVQIANPLLGKHSRWFFAVEKPVSFAIFDFDRPSFADKPEVIAVDIIERRGFPDEVRCTLADWVGGVCNYCNEGYNHNDMHYSPDTCSRCKGQYRLPGIADRVCGAWPVTRVTFDGAKPYFGQASNVYAWIKSGDRDAPPGHRIPAELFSLMVGYRITRPGIMQSYPTEAAAFTALSDAAIRLGRQQAGIGQKEEVK